MCQYNHVFSWLTIYSAGPLQILPTLTILRLQQYTFLAQKPRTTWVIWYPWKLRGLLPGGYAFMPPRSSKVVQRFHTLSNIPDAFCVYLLTVEAKTLYLKAIDSACIRKLHPQGRLQISFGALSKGVISLHGFEVITPSVLWIQT